MTLVRFYWPNKGCFFSSPTSFGLSKHVCRLNTSGKRQKLYHPIANSIATDIVHDANEPPSVENSHVDNTTIDATVEDNANQQLMKYCSLVHESSEMKSQDVMNAVHRILLDDSFDINLFWKELPTIASCRKLCISDF